MAGDNQPAQFEAAAFNGGTDSTPITAGNSEIAQGFNNYSSIYDSKSDTGSYKLHDVGFYDSQADGGQQLAATSAENLANGKDDEGLDNLGRSGEQLGRDTTAPALGGDQRNHNSAFPPLTETEREAIDANSKTTKDLFPGDDQRELRDAAFRELMRHECVPGYPPNAEAEAADRKIIEQHGARDKVDNAIKERAKQPRENHCVPMS